MTDYEKIWLPKIAEEQKYRDSTIRPEFGLKELPSKDLLYVYDIPEKSGVLSAKELEITETPASALAKIIAEGALSATEVLTAFAKRATIAHQLTNCATEFMLDDAFARAKELDEYFAKNNKTVGPLHGVPMSVKEHIAVGNRKCNAGYVAWIDQKVEDDSLIVAAMKKAGAVFFVRTNQPQSLMHLDSSNNIYGTTVNGFNRLLSAGGSSGGEGAILGMKGSPLGIGSDIGGSIRAPAAFNGCFGMRPTAQRLSGKGAMAPGGGQISIVPTVGPFGQSLEDIELFMKTYVDQEPWKDDITVFPIPWRTVEPTKDITIGIMYNDGTVTPHPPILRGLATAEKKLKEAGIKVVEWEPFYCEELFQMALDLYLIDGGKACKAVLAESGEPIHPLTQLYFDVSTGEQSVAVNQRLNYERDTLRQKYHDAMKARGVDFILCPTYGGTAPIQGTPKYWTYTALWNILDMPSTVFPTGLFSDPKLDPVAKDFKPLSKRDTIEQAAYEPEKLKDAPIALQLVGTRYMDEDVIAASKIVYDIIKE